MAELWWGLGMLLGVEGELWVWKGSCGCGRGAEGVEGELWVWGELWVLGELWVWKGSCGCGRGAEAGYGW